MTSRGIVKRAIHFQLPTRIPWNFDSNRTPDNGMYYSEDMLWGFLETKPLQDGINEWGVGYESLSTGQFGEPKTFPLEGRNSLDSYVFPDEFYQSIVSGGSRCKLLPTLKDLWVESTV